MAKKKEVTVEDKLRALYDLQLIDSRIDKIKNISGELPLEVEDLEDEIAGLNSRLSNFAKDISNLEIDINNKKLLIEESKMLAEKYDKQQKEVRNNREFDALAKEIEYQGLEIQLAEKNINEYLAKIEQKKITISSTGEKLARQEDHLSHKKAELDDILKETEKEQKMLDKKSIEYSKSIDDNLLSAYKRIRNKVKNGLAVVSIERGAAVGSFFTIPPQVQVEIATRKKITIDEYSGRILVDATLAEEEKNKIDSLFS